VWTPGVEDWGGLFTFALSTACRAQCRKNVPTRQGRRSKKTRGGVREDLAAAIPEDLALGEIAARSWILPHHDEPGCHCTPLCLAFTVMTLFLWELGAFEPSYRSKRSCNLNTSTKAMRHVFFFPLLVSLRRPQEETVFLHMGYAEGVKLRRNLEETKKTLHTHQEMDFQAVCRSAGGNRCGHALPSGKKP
jgi:hypothetical protein